MTIIPTEVIDIIDKSVLCWLATVNDKYEPNVSPKEMFALDENQNLIIANIASPKSVRNIKINPNVCVSFLDIFIQKGIKINGIAQIIEKGNAVYDEKYKILTNIYSDIFSIHSIINIEIKGFEKIIAPSYMFFPATTEESQIKNAMRRYNVQPISSK